MTIEAMKDALAHAQRNERHKTVAETRFWCDQYKLLVKRFIAEAEKQEPLKYTVNVKCARCGSAETYDMTIAQGAKGQP